jgi:hypothetical protein
LVVGYEEILSTAELFLSCRGRIAMYQLKGKASMSWDQPVQVQHIRERDITWQEFKMYFERIYLTKRYYDRNMKEFFELKLDNKTIDEYERKFL